MESWQQPVKIKDVAGMDIEEQKKVVFIVLSSLDTFSSTLLISMTKKIMEILESRGLGEDLSLGGINE